jgi:hypothetical protein
MSCRQEETAEEGLQHYATDIGFDVCSPIGRTMNPKGLWDSTIMSSSVYHNGFATCTLERWLGEIWRFAPAPGYKLIWRCLEGYR